MSDCGNCCAAWYAAQLCETGLLPRTMFGKPDVLVLLMEIFLGCFPLLKALRHEPVRRHDTRTASRAPEHGPIVPTAELVRVAYRTRSTALGGLVPSCVRLLYSAARH